MNRRELKLKTISNQFAIWEVRIQNLTSLNLYDANLFSETSICNILNAIFNYKLKNVNLLVQNHPAIDLADDYNKIAVQVTSSKTKAKIQATIDKFFNNELEKKYDEILIIILGKKQKSYSNINVKKEFAFDKDRHILDFKDLLKFISLLPTRRIEKIANLLEQENLPQKTKQTKSNAAKLKRNLALKKKLKKDLLQDNIPREDSKYAMYTPEFKYDSVIIRSVDDTSWPKHDDTNSGKINSWFKINLWDFYHNGLELISRGGYAIFDEEGYWDILDWQGDTRENNPKYKKTSFFRFPRIPYEYIVDYDIELDDYYDLPTIYVEYAKDGMPYEEILCGKTGYYDDKDPHKSRLPYYFETEKRKKLK